jgi:hypothetical protein
VQKLADELNVDILAKVTFTFTPDIIMSPLALPREILDVLVNKLITNNKLGNALHSVLLQLKNRPNMEEMWPDEYRRGMRKGKRRILALEGVRKDKLCMREILSANADILKWWDSIDAG